MHATEYLKQPAKHETGPVVVLFGGQRHLKQSVLKGLAEVVFGSADDDSAVTQYAGREADLKAVSDELLTVSMWGDRRLVVISDADEFISKNRAGLEKYVEKPSKKSLLVLDVASWPKNTRLAKAVDKIGLAVECSELKGAQLIRWLTDACSETYGKQLGRDAAALMTELAGSDLGLLDQELSKLTAYVGDRGRIEAEDVRALVGGWKAETTWAMIDAIRDGDVGAAFRCLDKLLIAGEAPQKIVGGMAYTFRKLAQATELSRQRVPLGEALRQAGIFPRDVAAWENYLRRVGRARAEKIYERLLTTDAALKGIRRLPERMQMDELLLQLSGKL